VSHSASSAVRWSHRPLARLKGLAVAGVPFASVPTVVMLMLCLALRSVPFTGPCGSLFWTGDLVGDRCFSSGRCSSGRSTTSCAPI
jgi:hypothetical protein